MAENSSLALLRKRIENRDLCIGVVGLGYVGLPTAIAFHDAGFKVYGIDYSEEVIESLRKGRSAISEEVGLKIPVGSNWTLTSSYEDSIPNCDIAIICVPTPVSDNLEPNLESVKSSIKSVISSCGDKGDLVIILESTVQPGTTVKCVEEAKSEIGEVSRRILISYCPERISPGEGGKGVGEVSRVIGSETSELSEILTHLYGKITEGNVSPVESIEVAEAAKLVENAQRDIDIAFVNELAILLPKLGLDVEQVLEAASTKWNFHRHKPGIGVGGHCIPIDPHYYIEIASRFGVASAMSPAARDLNSSMPRHSAREVIRLCGGEAPRKILILGFSYKPNVSDSRETPVQPLIDELLSLGTEEILVWDPHSCPLSSDKVSEIPDPYGHEGVECIVIATAHDEVVNLDWGRLRDSLLKPRIFDGRRCIDPHALLKDGWAFHAIGRPMEGD